MKGYKAFNSNWTCRNLQYEVGKTYELPEDEKLEICHRGFHFCANLVDVFAYYDKDSNIRIAEVEAFGHIQQEGTKFCTDKIKIVKEIYLDQLQKLFDEKCNAERGNIGPCNSGFYNSGLYNSGDRNSGDFNSGFHNSGGYNSGNYNSGNHNNGCHNAGNRNDGSHNSGNCNKGNCNSGDYNGGSFNTGSYNSGDFNSGFHNSGDYNSGVRNSGNYNSGYQNKGNYNSGRFNDGDLNSGYLNSGDRNSGIFNTNEPKMRSFNKMTDITFTEFIDSIDYSFHCLCERISNKDLYPEDFDRIRALPNFDAKIFKKLTGIDIE